ncbi:Hemolysin, contains CBS domains [Catalinimonas alkaloidigena]|uniref:Hemolysin, contains CBS domains n=1 Tax=Catalinimonas alkaloidigena TaxID=1075417 RepID=A0A1G9EW81_9BACT|nr:hemolysin family protein [Catalinimonas alkaloidigena]SDK80333.1 Hemolysin, contains CBS domains [Catalinimonas alkaloidigena]
MEYVQFLLIALFLLLSAFFSGIEIAFVSSNKLVIELQRKRGTLAGYILSYFVAHPSRFIAAMLIGNTIAISAYGIVMAAVLNPWLEPVLNNDIGVLLLQTIISTLIVLPVAEFLPKSLFMINPNRMLSALVVPLAIIYGIMYLFVFLIVNLARLVIEHLFRMKYSEDRPVFGITDVNNYIQNTITTPQQEEDAEINARIFSNAVEFKSLRVRECMIPRTDIVAIDKEDGLEELKQVFMESGHSRIPVYKENIDDIVGFCHSSALFKKPQTLEEIISPIIIVPETLHAKELLVQFISEHKSIALVVDEFGGTSGLVTIEDVMEEIFGEIQDEHDEEDWVEQKIDAHTYLLSARHEVDYLNEKYQWNIPEGDYETLGGYIISIEEDLPKVGEVIDAQPFRFTITSMQDARIDTVQVTVLTPQEED